MAAAICAAAICWSASFAACAGATSVEAIRVMITNQCTKRDTRRGRERILVPGGRLRLTARRIQQGFHLLDLGLLPFDDVPAERLDILA